MRPNCLFKKKDPRPVSVRTHLVKLVLAAVLPLLIFAALMFWRDVQLRRQAIERGMRDTARALSLAVDREIGTILAEARTLAGSPLVDSGDFKTFYNLSAGGAENNKSAAVALFDESGQMIINTTEPFGMRLPNPLRQNTATQKSKQKNLPQGNQGIETVLKTGQPVFSDLFQGLVSKLYLLSVTVPVVRHGKTVYALSVAVTSDHLTALLREQALPAEWRAVLVDKKGTIIARTTAPEKFVGRPASAALIKQLSEHGEGWDTGLVQEGTRVYYSFARSKLTGWGVAIAAPRAVIDAPMNQSIAILTGGAALLLMLAISAAFIFGRRISTPISRLAWSAEAIQRGEKVELKEFAVTEVRQLHEALVDASAMARAANAAHIRDLDERKKLEAQLLQAQKMESIGTLAGGIAHDFNNILNIIHGYAFLLSESGGEKEQLQESVNVINETVQRGSALVQQLLTMGQKSKDTRFASLNVNSLIEALIKIARETFPKTIEVISSLDPDLPPISGHKTQIEQVLLNFFVNARDAMPGGGSLNFRTYSVDAAVLQSAEPAAGRYVCIEVTDTGIGMDESTRTRIFEPFFTTKDKSQRAGLGLSVVYGIVRNHQGHIDVQSKPMSGTTFRVYLPISHSEVACIEPEKETRSSEKDFTDAATVLIVEDEAHTVRALEKVLSARGYKVLKAHDGQMALDLFAQHKTAISVVLLDMGLPKIAGTEVLRQMKIENPAVKVVIASGYFGAELKTEIDQAGVKEFLQKPYRPDEVVQTLRSVLEGES